LRMFGRSGTRRVQKWHKERVQKPLRMFGRSGTRRVQKWHKEGAETLEDVWQKWHKEGAEVAQGEGAETLEDVLGSRYSIS